MSYPGSEGARMKLEPGEYTRQTKADPLGRGRMVSTNVNDMTGLEDQLLMYCPAVAHLNLDLRVGQPARQTVLNLINSVPNGRYIRRIDKTSKGLIFMVTEKSSDPWGIDLRREEKKKILQRCIDDPNYFFDEVIRVPGKFDLLGQSLRARCQDPTLGMSGRSWPRLLLSGVETIEDEVTPISKAERDRLIARAGLTKEELEGAGGEYGVRRLILQRLFGKATKLRQDADEFFAGVVIDEHVVAVDLCTAAPVLADPRLATPGVPNPDGTYTITFDYDRDYKQAPDS